MSYPYRDGGLSGPAAAARALDTVDKQVGAENVAAVLIEPIQGEGGFVVPAPGFLPALATWARDAGAVFIADEIQTGFCRTGTWFASSSENVEPDLVATAKGMAGGLPLAGVTGRASIMDSVHAGGLGGTYGGNPVACAAALAAIETMRELDLCAAARRIESVMRPRLDALAARDPRIGDVRGRGAMLAVEIVAPAGAAAQAGATEGQASIVAPAGAASQAGATEGQARIVAPAGVTPDPVTTGAIAKACHAAGLLTLTCGTYGNVLRFLPPLVIDDATLGRGLDILDAAVAAT
jgi:4-aminobutyrate aminotransferase/(S)-3-amino-2-methylpropionate transaminase